MITRELPPPHIYDKAVKLFEIDFDKGIVFTVFPNIHSKFDMPMDLVAHEATHLDQQEKMGVDVWWTKYFDDPSFRLQEEVEAYRNQYLYCREKIKDRNELARHLTHFAKSLSGSMYGHILTYQDALKVIKS